MSRTAFIKNLSKTRKPRLRLEGLEDRTVPAFVTAPTYDVGLTGSKPVAVATGDFNGDGELDVVTANEDNQFFVSFLAGNGDGSFQTAANIGIGRAPVDIRAADLNGDSNLDIVTANKADNSVSVLLGNGDGTFAAAVTYSTGATTAPAAVAIGDLNGDGHLDLASVNNSAGTTTIFLGDGTGLFSGGGTVPVAPTKAPTSIALSDFNNDGDLDIAVVSGGFGHLDISLNNGDGTFATAVNYATGFVANTVVVGEFNGDGQPDVAVAHAFPSGDGVSILLGNANGTFLPFVKYNAGNQTPSKLAVVDLDGDGAQDLVTANGLFANNSLTVLPGNGNGTFGTPSVYNAGQGPSAVAVGDFNGDGRQDLVATNSGDTIGKVSFLSGNGDGTLRAPANFVVSGPGPIVSDDFTNDGNADVVLITSGGGFSGLALFPGLGNGNFGARIQSPAITQPSGLAVGDFNNDSDKDIAVSTSGGKVFLLLGNGAGSFALSSEFAAGASPAWIAAGDFNNDGNQDAAVANNSGTDGISILLGDGAGGLSAPTAVTTGAAGTYVAAADLNGDGVDDLAVINGGANKVTVVLNDGSGAFGAPASFTTPSGPGSVSVGDLNGDGHLDLAVPSFFPPASGGGGSGLQRYLNNGTGTFSQGPDLSTGSRPIGSAVLDMNGDGRPDIVTVNNFADNVYVFHATAAGGFEAPVIYVVGDRPTWLASGDFNNDGNPDLAVVNSNAGTVTLLATPLTASGFQLDFSIGTATAGEVVQVTVRAVDLLGNVDTSFSGSVSFSSSDVQATLPGDYAFTPADKGAKTFDVILRTAGSATLTVTSSVGTGVETVDVDPAAASQFTLQSPSETVAGVEFGATFTVLDEFGNIDTNFAGSVSFSSSDVQATLPSDYQFIPADLGVKTFAVTLRTAGSRSFTVTSSVGTDANTVEVTPAAASQFTLQSPTQSGAGVPFSVTVTALDEFGNIDTNFAGSVGFSSNDIQATLPGDYQFTAADLGVKSFDVTLRTAGSRSVTLTSSVGTGGGSVDVAPAAASQLAIQTPAQLSAGVPFNLTVTARDQFGNIAPDFVGTVAITSSDGQAVLPADYVFTLADAGSAVLQATLKTAGPQSLTAQSAGLANGEQEEIPVAPGAAVKLGFVQGPTATFPGTPMRPVSVQIQDEFGNAVPSETFVTLSFADNPNKAKLKFATAFTDANGLAVFPKLTLNKIGAGYTLVATSAAGNSAVSAPFMVYATKRFKLILNNTKTIAGDSFTVTVAVIGRGGKPDTDYRGTIHFSSTSTLANLPADYTFQAGDNGLKTFDVTFSSAGSRRLTVSDTLKPKLKRNARVLVSSDEATTFTVTQVTPIARVNRPSVFLVTAVDQFGNRAKTYAGTVKFSTTAANATLPVPFTFKPGNAGRFSLRATFLTTGTNLSLTVEDEINPAIAATLSGLTIV